jgi:hypothetical protein
MGLLFSCLTAGLVVIGVAALRGGATLIGVAGLVLAVWMATLAARGLRGR